MKTTRTIKSTINIVKKLLIVIVIAAQFSGSALAIIQNNVVGPSGTQIDKSNASGGFLIENAQQGAAPVEGGLLLYDVNNSKLRSIVNENGVLKINIDGLGTLKRILQEDDLGSFSATEFNARLFNGDVFNGGVFRGTFVGDGSGLTGVATSNGSLNNMTLNNGTAFSFTITNSTINGSNTILDGRVTFTSNGYLQDPRFNGTALFKTNSIAQFNGSILIPSGAGAGKVLTSDANGGATWQTPSSGSVTLVNNGDIYLSIANKTTTPTITVNGNLAGWAGTLRPAGAVVGTTDTQILSNKTLEAPVLNGSILIPTGAGLGKVLTSDGSGYATWGVPSGGGSLSSPVITSLSPADGATGVAINSNLVINFSTVVAEGNGDITIHRVSDNVILETIDSNDSSKLTYSNNKVTINPSGSFNYSIPYYVLIENGAIASGLDITDGWVGISSTTDWNFTAEGPAAIAVSSRSPADNATGVSRTSNFSITFNVPVSLSTLSSNDVIIKKTSDNSVFDNFAMTDGKVTLSAGNTVVTFNPAGNLEYSNGYYLEVAANTIENSYTAADYFTGYSGSTAWNITTQAPANLSATETFSLPTNNTGYSSTTNVANMQSSDTGVKNVTMTNDKVAGDSTVVVAFNLSTNLPSTITLVGGTVITFGTDAVVPDSYADRYVVPTQEYSFYVDTGTNKLVISNEPSGFGVYTARVITAIFRNY